MTKVWHPTFKDLSIEVDEAEVAAHVAAGWLKGKPRSASTETTTDESVEAAEAEEEKPKAKAKGKSSNN